MAFIDTTLDDDNYLFSVAKVRSLRGECILRMSTQKVLLHVLRYLLALDDEVRITTSNELGKYIFKKFDGSKHLIAV